MWRKALQGRALRQSFASQAKVKLGEVPQSSVDELGRTTTRAAGKVTFFQESNPQTPRSGVERDAGPGDATADNRDVEQLGPHSLDLFLPLTE
jgi:hypothetical protein